MGSFGANQVNSLGYEVVQGKRTKTCWKLRNGKAFNQREDLEVFIECGKAGVRCHGGDIEQAEGAAVQPCAMCPVPAGCAQSSCQGSRACQESTEVVERVPITASGSGTAL